VGGAVGGRKTGTVDAEGDGQVLQADVVDDLVVTALEEGRVDGDDRSEPLGGHAGGKRDRVLFGDAHIEKLLGALRGEL